MTQILIVEKHPAVAIGTRQMIEKFIGPAASTVGGTFWKALAIAGSGHFDLAIVDLATDGPSPAAMVKKFRGSFPQARLLIFSGYQEGRYAVPCVKAGAQGFVSKMAGEAELRHAVETVLYSGKVYLGQHVRELALESYLRPGKAPNGPSLTLRERQVLLLLYERQTVSQVAAALNIPARAVHAHQARLLAKLGATSMAELFTKYEQFFLHR